MKKSSTRFRLGLAVGVAVAITVAVTAVATLAYEFRADQRATANTPAQRGLAGQAALAAEAGATAQVKARSDAASAAPSAGPQLPEDRAASVSISGAPDYSRLMAEAQRTGHPETAYLAADAIRRCDTSDRVIASLEKLRGNPVLSDRAFETAYGEAQQVSRLCQALTPEQKQAAPDLAMLAVKGGIEGAAALYLRMVDGRVPHQHAAAVGSALLKDGYGGHKASANALALLGPDLGLPNFDQAVFFHAFQAPELNWLQSTIEGIRNRFHLNDEELSRAKRLAAEVREKVARRQSE